MRVRPDVKHIKISDFPRTPWAVSFGLRPALMKTFNYCRQYPHKMESLKAVLIYVMQQIAKWEASAKTIEFEGGSQRKPLQSATFVTPALTMGKDGELQPFKQPVRPHSDKIEYNGELPTHSEHESNPAWVVPPSELPKRPAMPQSNPLKPQRSTHVAVPEVEEQAPVQEAQTAQVGAGYTPTLEAVLAANQQS